MHPEPRWIEVPDDCQAVQALRDRVCGTVPIDSQIDLPIEYISYRTRFSGGGYEYFLGLETPDGHSKRAGFASYKTTRNINRFTEILLTDGSTYELIEWRRDRGRILAFRNACPLGAIEKQRPSGNSSWWQSLWRSLWEPEHWTIRLRDQQLGTAIIRYPVSRKSARTTIEGSQDSLPIQFSRRADFDNSNFEIDFRNPAGINDVDLVIPWGTRTSDPEVLQMMFVVNILFRLQLHQMDFDNT